MIVSPSISDLSVPVFNFVSLEFSYMVAGLHFYGKL